MHCRYIVSDENKNSPIKQNLVQIAICSRSFHVVSIFGTQLNFAVLEALEFFADD